MNIFKIHILCGHPKGPQPTIYDLHKIPLTKAEIFDQEPEILFELQ